MTLEEAASAGCRQDIFPWVITSSLSPMMESWGGRLKWRLRWQGGEPRSLPQILVLDGLFKGHSQGLQGSRTSWAWGSEVTRKHPRCPDGAPLELQGLRGCSSEVPPCLPAAMRIFMCFLVIHLSLEKCLCRFCAPFLIGLSAFFLLLSCQSSLYWVICILGHTRSLIRYMIFKYFSHPVGCHFTFLTVSFEAQKLSIWVQFNLSAFFLLPVLLVLYQKRLFLTQVFKY